MFENLYEAVILAAILGCGGVLFGFFRRLQKTSSDLCKKVENLQKALIILASALDRQTNMLHPEKNPNSDLDDLVSKVLDD